MPWLLWPLFVAALIGSLLAAAFAWAMQRGDAAGNGLGQLWFLATLATAWLLALLLLVAAAFAPVPVDVPEGLSGWLPASMGVAFAGATLAAQIAGLPAMLGGRLAGRRAWWPPSLALAPVAVSVYAAWRGIGLPLPAPVALWGCGGVVVGSAALALGAGVAHRRARARRRDRI